MLLGAESTETNVKASGLKDVDVIVFATHGLLSGEIDTLTEPGLVLTPPCTPSAQDDGILQASEITAMDISAQWVVLSACNTASGRDVAAPAFTGLARAF